MNKAMAADIDKQVENKLAHRIKELEAEELTKAEVRAYIVSLIKSTPYVIPPVAGASTYAQAPTPSVRRQAKVTLNSILRKAAKQY